MKITELDFLDISEYLNSNVKALVSLSKAGNMKDDFIRDVFISKFFSEKSVVIFGEQVHRTKIAVVDRQTKSPVCGVDGIFTRDKSVVLAVFFADCMPVFFYDPISEFAGLIHLGWRGISQNFVISTVSFLEKEIPSSIPSVKVVMGPGICGKHFEISQELAYVFPEIYLTRKKDKVFVNLRKVVKDHLVNAGIKEKNIYDLNLCSFEEENLFSFRRNKTEERNAAFLKLGSEK